jgi:TolB protein
MKYRKARLILLALGFFWLNNAGAQVIDSARVISLTGSFTASRERRVHVLPMNFPAGDSIRAIMQRDFVNGNRIQLVRGGDSLSLPTRDGPDYEVFQQIGAEALVHVVPVPSGGIIVTLHDVALKREAGSRQFELPGRANSAEWRWALHGVSDEVHEWIARERGIAQTRIAFVRKEELWVVDMDGANLRRLEGGMILHPEWHPVEPVLAFSALVGGGAWQIGVKPLADGATRWLTSQSQGTNDAPTFSPDGKQIYFTRSDDQSGSIMVIPYAGGTGRSIISSRASNFKPLVQPDGGLIMLVSDRTGSPLLYTMTSDGSNLSPFISPGVGVKTWLESPSWSPDGKTIAYQSRVGRDSHYQIETADFRTRHRVLRTSNGENEGPSWAPDSKHIVYESTDGGIKQLWIMDLESGAKRQLTFGPDPAKNAAWSPRYK